MIEEHENQLREFDERLSNTIGRMVARYAVRFTWMVVVLAFAAGGWATKLQSDMNAIRAVQGETKTDVKELKASLEAANATASTRNVEWAQWRERKDAIDENCERRVAWLESLERSRRP